MHAARRQRLHESFVPAKSIRERLTLYYDAVNFTTHCTRRLPIKLSPYAYIAVRPNRPILVGIRIVSWILRGQGSLRLSKVHVGAGITL